MRRDPPRTGDTADLPMEVIADFQIPRYTSMVPLAMACPAGAIPSGPISRLLSRLSGPASFPVSPSAGNEAVLFSLLCL